MSHTMSHILVVYQVQAVDQVIHLHKSTEISMHPVLTHWGYASVAARTCI